MQKTIKRLMDVAGGTIALILFSPLILVLAILVRRRMGSPVFFRQERVGLNERIFRVWKFRTMSDARDTRGHLLPDAQRLTPLGAFMRRWSLDELPQLFNVIGGSVSLVGPRPLLIRYLPRYTAEQRRRHLVKPGMTGLAQIHGRNSLSWEQRFAYDVAYVDSWSLWLDITIILKTVGLLVTGAGAGVRGAGETQEFWGTATPPAGAPHGLPTEERETLVLGKSD